jgi:hypothetical protein
MICGLFSFNQGKPKIMSEDPKSVIKSFSKSFLLSTLAWIHVKWVINPVWFRVPSTFLGIIRFGSFCKTRALKSSYRNCKKLATQPNCNRKQPDFQLQLGPSRVSGSCSCSEMVPHCNQLQPTLGRYFVGLCDRQLPPVTVTSQVTNFYSSRLSPTPPRCPLSMSTMGIGKFYLLLIMVLTTMTS